MMKEPIKSIQTKNITALAIIMLAFVYSYAVLPLPTAYAQALDVEVQPTNIYLEAKQPADVRAPFTITNNSDKAITLNVGYKQIDSRESSNGIVVLKKTIDSNLNTFFRNITIIDEDNTSYNQISLGPKQSKDLQMRVTVPENEIDNDYYYTLAFIESEEDKKTSEDIKESQKASSIVRGGIGINTFIAVGQKKVPSLTIEKYTTDWFRQTGPTPFYITISNNGTHYTRIKGKILIKNMFGKAVGEVRLPETPILANTKRDIYQIAQDQVVWQNRYILGNYTAELLLQNDNEEIINRQTIRFIAVPTPLLFSLGLMVLGLYYIYRKTRVFKSSQKQ